MSINISNRRIIMTPALATAPATTSFDPGFSNGAHTLSNNNLTVTQLSGTGISRTLASHLTGLYYWEFTLGTFNNFIAGICSSTEPSSGFISDGGKTAGLFAGSGWLGSGLTGTTTGPALAITGHVIGVAMDATNKLIWAKDWTAGGNWNTPAAGDPAAGTFGCNFSACTDLGTAAIFVGVTCAGAGDTTTYNFGATPYTGTAPSGFGTF